MRIGRRITALLAILPLAGCAVFGPVVDADMEHAPYEACYNFADTMAPPDAPPQCVSVQYRPAGGQWQAFVGTLSAGDELLAVPSAAPECSHGNYTHFVLEGSSDAGAMRIAVPDGFGRGDMGRSFAWHAPRSRWTADNIGTTVHIPAAARVTVSEGQLRLTSACFKSYTHYRIPGEHRRHLL
jgi:hypothetical protein